MFHNPLCNARLSPEHNEIINRLKICRKEQGNQIDKAKGLIVKAFPLHWTRWNKTNSKQLSEFNAKINFYNKLLIDKRPYFMRWLYSDYNRRYKQHRRNYDNFCVANFCTDLDGLMAKKEKNRSTKELDVIAKYNKSSPLLDSNCNINKICHYMEKKIQETKSLTTSLATEKNILLLKNHSIPFDREKYQKLYNLFRQYKTGKRNFATIKMNGGDERYKTLEQYNKAIKMEALAISSDISELANLAIAICYEAYPNDNKSFAWDIFGEGIIDNIKKNRSGDIMVPFWSKRGDIKYLGDTYKMRKIILPEEDAYDNYI